MTTPNAAPAASPAPSAPSGGAPSGGAPSGSPSASISPQRTSPTNTAPVVPRRSEQRTEQRTDDGKGDQKPAREPWKVKHKHVGSDGNELELELDLSEHLSSYKRRMKSDKEEREVSLEEAFEKFPFADGAYRRMEEGKKAIDSEKNLRARIERLGEQLRDPGEVWGILEHLYGGPEKVRDLIIGKVNEWVAEDKLTPAQRDQKRKEDESNRAYRERERALKTQEAELAKREAAIKAAHTKETIERYQREWPEHLKRHGVPATRRAMALMAETKRDAKRHGIHLSDDQAAKHVRDELAEILRGVGDEGDGKALRDLLGDKGIEAAQKEELARLEQQPGRGRTSAPASPAQRVVSATKPGGQKKTWSEYRAELANTRTPIGGNGRR